MSRCLDINFNYIDNTAIALTTATAALDTRIGDYQGVRNRISNINSNTSNLYTANTYIDKKNAQLREKRDKLRKFNRDITGFGVYAKAQDTKTAAAIHISGHRFYHREGLAHGPLYTIAAVISDGVEWLKDKAKKAVDWVKNTIKKAWKKTKEFFKDFYEKNKYWIDVVVDVVSVVASFFAVAAAVAALVAASGPLAIALAIGGLFAAGWGLLKSSTSLVYDSTALYFHIKGNDALAEQLNGNGLKEVFKEAFGDKVGGMLFAGLDIVATVCSIANLANDTSKLFACRNLPKNLSPERAKLAKHILRKREIKLVLGFDMTKTSGWKKTAQVVKNIKFCISGPINLIKNGGFKGMLKSVNITKDAYSIYSTVTG